MGDNFAAFHAGKTPAATARVTDKSHTLAMSSGRKIVGNEVMLLLGPLG